MQGRLQEVPETLLKLWFIYEGKNSRKVQVEKGGNRGHDVFSDIKSLGANVTGKFLTAIPADITVKDPDTGNIPSLSADRPLQKSKFFLSFPLSSYPIPFRAAQGSCRNVSLSRGCRVGPGDAPFSREDREGMREGGQSLPGLPVPSRGCLTVLHNLILAWLLK